MFIPFISFFLYFSVDIRIYFNFETLHTIKNMSLIIIFVVCNVSLYKDKAPINVIFRMFDIGGDKIGGIVCGTDT